MGSRSLKHGAKFDGRSTASAERDDIAHTFHELRPSFRWAPDLGLPWLIMQWLTGCFRGEAQSTSTTGVGAKRPSAMPLAKVNSDQDARSGLEGSHNVSTGKLSMIRKYRIPGSSLVHYEALLPVWLPARSGRTGSLTGRLGRRQPASNRRAATIGRSDFPARPAPIGRCGLVCFCQRLRISGRVLNLEQR